MSKKQQKKIGNRMFDFVMTQLAASGMPGASGFHQIHVYVYVYIPIQFKHIFVPWSLNVIDVNFPWYLPKYNGNLITA